MELVELGQGGVEGGGIDLDDYEGRVVVLEFWATWCSPCVDAIQHLNELEKKLPGGPFAFVSVTEEPAEVVAPFLAKTPISGQVARLVGGQAARQKLGLSGLPATVIIGPDGNVAGITYPHFLEDHHLERILLGQPTELPVIPHKTEFMKVGDGFEPLYVAMVRPSKPDRGSPSRIRPGLLEQSSTPPLFLLSNAFGVSPCRVQVQGELPEGLFDLIVRLPTDEDADALMTRTRETAQAALLKAFGLTARKTTREMDVLVIEALPDGESKRTPAAKASGKMMMCGGGRYRATRARVAELAECLELQFEKPVIDKTGVEGAYVFDFAFGAEDGGGLSEEKLRAALNQKAGLELVNARLAVDVLLVQAAGSD